MRALESRTSPHSRLVDFYPTEHEGVFCDEGEFAADDNSRLSYTHYRPAEGTNRTAVIYLHGIESHSAWFKGPASLLCEGGYDVFCLDRRGSGRNRENKGMISGHADSYEQLLSDIHHFLNTLHSRYENIVLTGSSWGGKLALAYVLAYGGRSKVNALILITPGLRALVDLPLLSKAGVFASLVLRPTQRFSVPIPAELFTTYEPNLDLIRRDPLRLHDATAKFFMQSLRLDWFIDRHILKNRLPTMLVLAAADRVIDNVGVLKVMRRGRTELLEICHYAEESHAVQLDAPVRLAQDMRRWMDSLSIN